MAHQPPCDYKALFRLRAFELRRKHLKRLFPETFLLHQKELHINFHDQIQLILMDDLSRQQQDSEQATIHVF
ncbi:hypothetical protein TH24_21235 [Thalassospira xiamenensis]|nr:hypothetical protein TH24_21235 [Thalassospira xiamenensis]